jgi:two-component system, NarL family, sensor histidine kinase DegS
VVTVEDNGIGFDPAARDADHLGMVGMRERADMLEGTFTIESSPGKGTRIYLEIPYIVSN